MVYLEKPRIPTTGTLEASLGTTGAENLHGGVLVLDLNPSYDACSSVSRRSAHFFKPVRAVRVFSFQAGATRGLGNVISSGYNIPSPTKI
jgi:hypothetical protein